MKDYTALLNAHYGRSNLAESILDSLEAAGVAAGRISTDILALFDELHAGGRIATRALAELAGLRSGMKVLDVGSGVGGPARTLAHEYGCFVTGLDITDEFVKAARLLSDMVQLEGHVSFQTGNALELPFADESFDVVWSQNTLMNIEDKEAAVKEASRVVRKEGVLVIETILAGAGAGLKYPTFWANRSDISFLINADAFRSIMSDAGLLELNWVDVTPQVIEGARKQHKTRLPLGLEVIYEDVPVKGRNTMSGFEQGQIIDVYAVYQQRL